MSETVVTDVIMPFVYEGNARTFVPHFVYSMCSAHYSYKKLSNDFISKIYGDYSESKGDKRYNYELHMDIDIFEHQKPVGDITGYGKCEYYILNMVTGEVVYKNIENFDIDKDGKMV